MLKLGDRIRRVALVGAGVVAALAVASCSGVRDADGQGAPTSDEAARFLAQASYGANDASIAQVKAAGYSTWIDQQMTTAAPTSHLAELDAVLAERRLASATASLNSSDFYYTYWEQAVTGPDQLRQRMKLALSEIFVVSLADGSIDTRGAGSYYDMLGTNAFGNFRTLLEQVTLHPMMGIYLTWLGNQKEDPATGRKPDENYAREVMQLMTIGLYQLNLDGTVKTDGAGRPIPTYSADDVAGLAKVFTGYSYYSAAPTAVTYRGGNKHAEATVRSMIAYPAYHSTSAKSFLGATIPASTTVDAPADVKVALDTLFNHPNVGPFISKQLIQRLVTSNPSPAYVQRVATVFNDNGRGVRGDMSAVVRAILLDPDARSAELATGVNYGKVREPLVRMAHWARAFNATSQTGTWLITSTSANTSLGQSALTSPSVFNFYRPGYVPPNTRVGNAGLVGPELQAVDEVTVAGYLNTLQSTVDAGIGTTTNGARDVRSTYAAETALASNPPALVDRVNLLLLNGRMSPILRGRIIEAVSVINVPATNPQPGLLNRAKLAIYMTMGSPEYLVQR